MNLRLGSLMVSIGRDWMRHRDAMVYIGFRRLQKPMPACYINRFNLTLSWDWRPVAHWARRGWTFPPWEAAWDSSEWTGRPWKPYRLAGLSWAAPHFELTISEEAPCRSTSERQ